MLKAIIIDDELDSIEALVHDIQSIPLPIEIVATFQEGIDGLLALQKLHANIDLVFLDIKMPRLTGFELLQKVDPIDFEVIFVTAYDEFALQAFDISAAHYLLKPVDKGKLQLAIEKVLKLRGKQEAVFVSQSVSVLLENLKHKVQDQKLSIPTLQGSEFCFFRDILYMLSDGNSTKIVAEKENYLSGYNIGRFEEKLPDELFHRIHNRYIVNMMHVKSYHKGKPAYVTMSDGKELNVSDQRKQDFRNRFKW